MYTHSDFYHFSLSFLLYILILAMKVVLHRYTFAQMQFKLFKQHILSVCLDQPSQIILFHLCIHYHSCDFIRTHDHHMMLKNCFRAFIEHMRFALPPRTFQQNTSSKLTNCLSYIKKTIRLKFMSKLFTNKNFHSLYEFCTFLFSNCKFTLYFQQMPSQIVS